MKQTIKKWLFHQFVSDRRNGYNAAISEQKKKAEEWLDTKEKEEVK